MRIPKSVKLTLWCSRGLAVLILVLSATLPELLRWYAQLRNMSREGLQTVLTGYYCCLPVILLALWNLDRLLREILKGQVFVRQNVRRISAVRWCCLAVGLICVPVAWKYPPILFIVVMMAFLALVVSVLTAVMDAAVSIREENDLTI